MPEPGLTTPAPTTGTIPVEIRRFPWIRRLAADYFFDHPALADFYAGDPAEPLAWRDAIGRARRHPRASAEVAAMLQAQQRTRGAPDAALAASHLLHDSDTVAVVTGQQAGLFGGPLFTLLKALTAVQLAEQVQREHRSPAVAIFWVDAEDHDWDEVRGCGLLDEELAYRSIELGDLPGAGQESVAHVTLDDSIESALARLAEALPPTEFTGNVLRDLKQAYRPGVGMADAFARWLESLLGPRGLIVFNSADPAAKPLLSELFAREVEQASTVRLATEAGAALQGRGYHAQATPAERSLAMFRLDDGREAIRQQPDGSFEIAGVRHSREQLSADVRSHPERFSPGVLLRPIAQDTLFPTVCYVSGPSELAYLGQLKQVYASFGVPMPLIVPRASATILDGNSMRFLQRHDFPLERLQARDEAALNELLGSRLPPAVEGALDRAGRAIETELGDLAAAVGSIDATLQGAAQSTATRMHDDLKKLQAKIIQAAKRKDETLRRQFQHAQAQAFPDGHPQERQVCFVYFLNKYGPVLIDRLAEYASTPGGLHQVVSI